jgi:hypothetical protein
MATSGPGYFELIYDLQRSTRTFNQHNVPGSTEASDQQDEDSERNATEELFKCSDSGTDSDTDGMESNPRMTYVLTPEASNDRPVQETAESERKCCISPCSGDKDSSKVFWCNICDATICDQCWAGVLAHQEKSVRLGTRDSNHSKLSLDDRDILVWILKSQTEAQNEDNRIANESSKWFGADIPNGDNGDTALNITSRFRELSMRENSSDQYPSLISFVGETGAGKSTMVNALIKIS